MSTVLAAIALIALLALGLWYYGRQPAKHRNLTPERLSQLVAVLLRQGFDGGVLFIESKHDARFLQLQKYAGRGKVGLQLDFPLAPWSGRYYERVKAALGKQDVPFTEQATWRPDTQRFLTVDLGTEVERAGSVLRLVAEDALGLDLQRDAVAYFRNVSSDPNAKIGMT